MNGIKNKIRKKAGLLFVAVCMFCVFGLSNPESVKAGVFDNAYSFYQTYGNEMAFQSGPYMEGEIYYATKAKKVVSGTQYTTIGWKVTILDSIGNVMDTIYYQLGGSNMTSIHVQEVNGYEYCLYKVTLSNIRARMNDGAKYALTVANANIIFDACTTTKLNGEVQGGMTDAGPSWGDVYTTYDGIANAQNWSSTTKETLKSYYNKSVKGLFYNLSVQGGEGIETVTGSGKYCFGTEVTISAKAKEGYHFSGWTGSGFSNESNLSIVLYGPASYTATAERNRYEIVYNGNGGTGNEIKQTVNYRDVIEMPNSGFELKDSCISGWSLKKDAKEKQFSCNETVDVTELVKSLGLENKNNAIITLYVVWDHGPIIEGEEIYVSLEDARKGLITEQWLADYVDASDEEDGVISYGKHERNSLLITNYSSRDFTDFNNSGYVTETFCATDSSGNQCKKIITVYIVDTTVFDADYFLGEVRFISRRYYKDAKGNFITEEEGGLKERSVWKWDSLYEKLLDQTL